MANIKPTERMTSAQRKFGTSGVILDGLEANSFNIPKASYNFIVKFELTDSAKQFMTTRLAKDAELVNLLTSFQVKSTDRPNFNMQVDTINQYNKTRQSPGKIEYQPLSMTFYDTIDSMALHLLDAYKAYYYGDFNEKGLGSFQYDTITKPDMFHLNQGDDAYGRSLKQQGNNNESYFFKRIDIFEIDGSSLTVHNIYNPVIETVNLGKKDHESEGEPQTFDISFKFDGITNVNPFNGTRAIGVSSSSISAYLIGTDRYGMTGHFKTWGEMDDTSDINLDPNETKNLPDSDGDLSFTSIVETSVELYESIDGLIGGFSDIWEGSEGVADTATNLFNSVTSGNIGNSISNVGSSVSNAIKNIGGFF